MGILDLAEEAAGAFGADKVLEAADPNANLLEKAAVAVAGFEGVKAIKDHLLGGGEPRPAAETPVPDAARSDHLTLRARPQTYCLWVGPVGCVGLDLHGLVEGRQTGRPPAKLRIGVSQSVGPERLMRYVRMPIERESPEEYGYDLIRYNLSESSVSDRSFHDLQLTPPNITLLYGEHRGDHEMRALIAADGAGLSPDDVLLTAGAAGALFIISTALLEADDHLVVVRPNYATNIETPRAIGCEISYHDLSFEDGFRLDVERLKALVTRRTKLISVTCPHNPTGVAMTLAELEALIAIAEEAGCRLLVDETYRDLSYGTPLPLAASLSAHAISVSSLSKAYGVPGIRMGWMITKDPHLQETFLAAKEQISICGSAIDEWVGLQVMRRRPEMLQATIPEMHRRLDEVSAWMSQEPLLEWAPPQGGVVCFPRMKEDPIGGVDAFYERLLKTHGTYVGPGHWFEMSDRHFRIGYGWPSAEALKQGLLAISAALRG